jgi:hypothetical protein
MAEFRFEAIAPDGAEVRDTVEAVDHESAGDALREKGLCVYRLRSVGSPEDLERRCAGCNHVNEWTVMVCANCGAPVRGPHVGPDEHVEHTELPEGLVVLENIDGTVTVTKTGWRRWGRTFASLVGTIWAFVLFGFINHPAARFAHTVLGLLGLGLVPYTLWALFARDEWHVGGGFFEQRRSLFGMDWGHTFRAGVIRLEQRGSGGIFLYRVSVLDCETSRTLCEEYSDSAARALAALLAQRTGWVLDDQIRDWSWLDNI